MARTVSLIVAAVIGLSPAACKKKAAAPDAGPATPPKTATAPLTPPVAPTATSWKEKLKSTDAKVRAEGAQSVIPSEHAAPPPELLLALADAEASVRDAAVKGVLGFILQNSDDSALAKLLDLAQKESDTRTRATVVRALAALGHRDVVPVFVRIHATEKDQGIRDEILATFGKVGDKRAMPVLVELLKLKEPPAAAIEAVRRVTTTAPAELMRLLGHTSPGTRKLAAQALGEIGDPAAVPELIKAAKDKDIDVIVEATSALALLGGPAPVPTILELTDHADARVRIASIRALATYRTLDDIAADQAFPKVLKHLKSGPNEVRIEAAKTVAIAKLKRSVPALREIAANAKEPTPVRGAVTEALGEIRDASAVPTLTALVGDKDPDVRTAAAKAVRTIGKEAAAAGAALVAAWKKGETDIDAQIEIVKALGAIGDKSNTGLLKEIGEKNDVPLVKAEAGGALLRLGSVDGAPILRPVLTSGKEWQERRAAARLLESRAWRERKGEKITPEQQAHVTAVLGLINDALKTETEPLVREELFRQLSKARGPAALAAQREGLKERVPYFRLMAAAGLCANGEGAGCDALTQTLEHPEASVRAEAARRIGWYRVQAAMAGLKKATDDPVLFVANSARRALARIERSAAEAPKK